MIAGEILREKGADIFRMKGVLAIGGREEKFVYQGVHMIFDGEFQGEWGADEMRCSKLVFIGKNLDKAALEASFRACLDIPENKDRIEAAEKVHTASRMQKNLLGAAQRDDARAVAAFLGVGADVNFQNSVGQVGHTHTHTHTHTRIRHSDPTNRRLVVLAPLFATCCWHSSDSGGLPPPLTLPNLFLTLTLHSGPRPPDRAPHLLPLGQRLRDQCARRSRGGRQHHEP